MVLAEGGSAIGGAQKFKNPEIAPVMREFVDVS
jgi:hypothetical protein